MRPDISYFIQELNKANDYINAYYDLCFKNECFCPVVMELLKINLSEKAAGLASALNSEYNKG